jgi:hypothetical protein
MRTARVVSLLSVLGLCVPTACCSAGLDKGLYDNGAEFARRTADNGADDRQVSEACRDMRDSLEDTGTTGEDLDAWYAGCIDAREQIFGH